jgi:hypothetical protein
MSLPNSDARRRKPRRSAMSIALRLVVTLVLLVAVTAGAGGLAWLVATADGPLAQDKVVNIPPEAPASRLPTCWSAKVWLSLNH